MFLFAVSAFVPSSERPDGYNMVSDSNVGSKSRFIIILSTYCFPPGCDFIFYSIIFYALCNQYCSSAY